MFSALQISKKLNIQSSDIVWSGASSFCAKQLKHYSGFDRKGITIYVCKLFVLLLHLSYFPALFGPVWINNLILRLSYKYLYISYFYNER